MLEKEELGKYAIISLVLVGLIAILLFFSSGPTGFAVYEQGDQTEFDLGTYVNTFYNGSAVVLVGGNLTGGYISKVFDAGNDAVWNSLTRSSSTPNLNSLYGVDGGGDVYVSTDLGTNWNLKRADYGRTTDTKELFSDSTYLYILATLNKEVWRSSDAGATWIVVNDSFADSSLFLGKADSNGNLFIVDGSGDIYSSLDYATSWAKKGDLNGAADNNPLGLAIDSNHYIYAVDGTGDVFKSINGGINWTKVNDGYGGSTGTDGMAVDSSDNLYILLNTKIYKSTDSGVTWNVINDSISPYANTLVEIEINSLDNLFILDAVGRTFKSTNFGISWTEQGDMNAGASNDPKGITEFIQTTNLSFQVKNCSLGDCSDGTWQTKNLTNVNLTGRYFQYKVYFISPNFLVTPGLFNISIDYSLINTAPVISIAFPQEGTTYGYNTSLSLNYSVFDNDNNLQSCWYNLDNGNNISLAGCLNTSFNISEGSHTLNIYANDSLGLVSSDSVSFNIAVGSPTIVLNSPINVYLNNRQNIKFSYTPTDIDLDYCELWGNFNGEFKLNQTENFPVSGSENNFNLNLSDGNYLWNIKCVDDIGNSAFNGNKSFYVDTTVPAISLTQPTGTKTSRTINAGWSVSDSSPVSCKYNVYRGENLEITNTSINCSANSASFDVTVDANFVFNFYVNDSAGNTNSASLSFSVDTSAPVSVPSSGGGGGGGGSYILPNQTGKIQVSLIGNIIARPGDNKKIPLNVKNIGKIFLNKCRLIAKGDISSWIYSTNIEGVAPGQNIDFAFDLNVPEGIVSGINKGSLEIKCEEANDIQNISISIPKEFSLIEIKDIKQEEDVLKINYVLDSSKFIGENIDIEIWLADENGSELTRIHDKAPINRDGLIERNIEMQLPEGLEGGVYFINFAFSNSPDNFIKKPVVLSITGKAVLDSEKGKFWVYIVFLLILGVAIFFIWRRHSKPDKPEKKEHNSSQKFKWLLRKKK